MSATTATKRNPLTVSDDGEHALLKFNSFADLLEWNEKGTDHRSAHMGGSSFYGAKDMPDAYQKAHKGLPRDGIEALDLAEQNVQQMERELLHPTFTPYNDVSGAEVDVALYLQGEPECMVNYQLGDEPKHERVVTIVASVAYHCAISKSAIKKNGQALMALMEAIESTGLQTEIWLDSIQAEDLRNFMSDNPDPKGKTGRIAVRVKAPGEMFDAGMFMYALTHDSFLRSILFNTMHSWPAQFRRALSISSTGHYGYPISKTHRMEDYPEGAIYIPSIRHDSQAGEVVEATLKDLDLLK